MTQTGLSFGTPQYMSREQAMGERTIDARSDICALGAVTYEMLVGGAALLATGSAVWLGTREAPTPVSARFDVALPGSVELYAVSGRRLALSVDGTQVLVVATKGGKVGLYLRRMDETEFRLVPGSEFAALGGNVDPTFSPDGESVLFRATNDLLRIPVSGGKPQRVDSAGAASWADGGRIVLARADTLWEISIEGGARRVISAPDRAAGIPRLDWPAVLPQVGALRSSTWGGRVPRSRSTTLA